MRRTSILLWTLLTGGAAFAALRADVTTYVHGNLTGVSPTTGGTLLFSDEKAVYFRTGVTTVAVPYAGIQKAELSPAAPSPNAPLYKVWSLHKRFSSRKAENQILTVEFRSDEGEEKTMTLELDASAASDILATIRNHTDKDFSGGETPKSAVPTPPPAEEWWGDGYWKTNRNAGKWGKTSPATAPDPQ